MRKFTKGNEVRLKTGGPRMIVEDILPNNIIVCTYIYNFVDHKRELFSAENLETAERLKYCPRNLLE